MRVLQGSSYSLWLVAVAKHSLLWRECFGRWWQPSRDIGILASSCSQPLSPPPHVAPPPPQGRRFPPTPGG